MVCSTDGSGLPFLTARGDDSVFKRSSCEHDDISGNGHDCMHRAGTETCRVGDPGMGGVEVAEHSGGSIHRRLAALDLA